MAPPHPIFLGKSMIGLLIRDIGDNIIVFCESEADKFK